ncbi:putative Sigma factor sigb regulation protein rsbq [Quillaja saponaria]|uniref:Sigma factor sigb regulation protein rsbq n=1 Tax=Quillaja saponaria TaxID=32244 RepID=A0AAD7Q2Y8_QUISA|nr:putative Sigma factor sigb regulation protein rsbq [Quillaja saponaria]
MVMLGKNLATSMNARIIGSGSEAIVLAHGFGGDQSVWDKILPVLAQNHSVLVFDWTFSGAVKDNETLFDPVKYSSYNAFADDLIDLMDEMEVKSSIFVGHSMSAMIGCIASTKRPELFKRLILVGASPRYINTDDYEGGFKRSEVDEIISNIELNYETWASAFAPLAVGASDTASVDKFQKCLKRMRPEIALSLAKTVFYSEEREVLDKVVTPCTIIQTSNDIVVPNGVAFYMQNKIKGKSTVEILDNTNGHFPQLTAHLQLLDVLKGILGLDDHLSQT